MTMKESAFSKQIRDDIAALCSFAHIYLIQDSYRTGRKPYDFYVVYKKYFYAIECKALAGQSLNFGCVTDRQIESLMSAWIAGSCSKAYLLIYSEYYKEVFVFDIKYWLIVLDEFKSVKSAKFDTLRSYANFMLKRVRQDGKLRWEINKVIY